MRVSIIAPVGHDQTESELVHSPIEAASPNAEHIVVSYGPADQQEIGGSRIVSGPRRGLAASYNAGLAAASGDFVCFLRPGAAFPPQRLHHHLEWLDAHPDFGAVCGRSQIDEKEEPASRSNDEITGALMAGESGTRFGAFTTRIDPLRRIGGFREFLGPAAELDVQLRLAEACRIGYRPEIALLLGPDTDQPDGYYAALAHHYQLQRITRGEDDLQRHQPPSTWAETATSPDKKQRGLINEARLLHRAGRKQHALRVALAACTAQPTSRDGWSALGWLLRKRFRR